MMPTSDDLDKKIQLPVSNDSSLAPAEPLRLTLERSSALMRRAAFEQAPIGKVLQTSDGSFRAINRTLCLMLGYSEVELLTLTVPELAHPEEVARDWEQYQDLLEGRIESFLIETRTFWRCGRALWGSLALSLVRDPEGKIEWIVSEIEELVPGQHPGQIEDKPSHQQNILEDMVNLGSWEWEPETGQCTWSDEFYRIYGLIPGSVIPSHERLLESIYADDKPALETTIREALERQDQRQMHCRLLRADGHKRQVLIKVRATRQGSDGKLGLSGALLDVTEQWQKARLVEQASILLTEQNRRMDQIVRLATHNLRSPLANAISLIQLLQEAVSDTEKQKYTALLENLLTQSLSNLDQMVTDLYHQMPEKLAVQWLSFQESLDRALIVLATEFRTSQARIETDFACPELEYAPVYLNSIIYNLVSNAIKYRSPERQLQIDLRTWNEAGKTFLEVEDNGIGIDLIQHRQQIFKLHEIFTSQADSHGVGLYLTHVGSPGTELEFAL